MNSNTYLLIFFSLIFAFTLAYFWYRGQKVEGNLLRVLLLFRGLALWALVLLLVNPVFKDHTVVVEKPVLNILVDNSSSVTYLADAAVVRDELNSLRAFDGLTEKFDVNWYRFGKDLKTLDTIPGFDDDQTNISKALQRLQRLQDAERTATLLISDGNSTYGGDYQFNTAGVSGQVYALVVGDTTQFEDLYIERINVNRYAYLNNKFPVEIFVGYNGNRTVEVDLEITRNNRRVYREQLRLEPGMSGIPVTAELEAGAVGVRSYRVVVTPQGEEKNVTNNEAGFAVEVIDERNRIAMISKILHPDLGSLKNSIEGSGQRTVDLITPDEFNTPEAYDLIIVYQPDRSFTNIFEALKDTGKNFWLIGGGDTDWDFVNNAQGFFEREITYSEEYTQGEVSPEFSSFQFEDPGMADYPPLRSDLGDYIIAAPYETLIRKKIGGMLTNSPLLFTVERNDRRIAVLDGSDLWKWRLWHYAENENFEAYDAFWSKLVQYLASGARKERLYVDYQPFYYANSGVRVAAGYYDKNYQYDKNERLQLQLKHNDSANFRTIPMLASDSEYSVSVNGLPAGTYSFQVSVPSQNLSRAGEFRVLGYEVERQFINTDIQKLNNLAITTGGRMLPLADHPGVLEELLKNEQYTPVQKKEENIVPLLEWEWLLFLTALFFAIEWFIRKYNGLI